MDHQIILNKNKLLIIDMVTNSEYLFKKYHNLKSIEAIEITKICEGLEELSLEELKLVSSIIFSDVSNILWENHKYITRY